VELASDTAFDPDATGEGPSRLEGMSHSGRGHYLPESKAGKF